MKLCQYGVLGLSMLLPMSTLADFQYQETTQITGGSMLGLMKMAGRFSRQAKDAGAPMVTTIYLHGNRMASISEHSMEIIDLDKETITNVDLDKRTYTEMTFEQIRQAMEQAMQQAKEKQAQQPASTPAPQQGQDNVQLRFTVNVRNTGVSKQLSGLNTSESILTMQMEGTDTTNGQKGAFAMTNDLWLAPDIPGYDEMREFNKKLGEKMGDIFSGSSLSSSLQGLQPNASQGISDMVKEVSKLKGIPLQQVMRMGVTANGEPLPAASEAPLPPSSSGPQVPSAGEVAQQSTSSAVSSAISSKLGGFGLGGFGHKKKADPPPDDTTNAQQEQAAQTANVLMESQTELTSFSSAPIDPAKLSVPAGFTQVQSPQMK